ncbi:MAG TPA: hypothetical protein IAA29_09820 [Candidatus Paenibacillus intestinavium]|nr:hypothetical protein [Candidatus Paenibacillus intestinavium]
MPLSFQINRIKIKNDSNEVRVVVLKQKDINIIIREELGHILLIDATDSYGMYFLASLFRHSMESNDVIFLEREDDSKTDLFIFNGAINPMDLKILRNIKSSIKYIKSEIYSLSLIDSHDETIWESWKHWKYEKQLRVKADKDLGVINSTQLGFELLAHQCSYLADSDSGHAHFDWYSTKSSIELIIRNIARNN